MDASQYKDYILVLLFVKYVSDKYGGRKDVLVEVPRGGSFQDMVALKGSPEIGDGLNKVISRLAEANELKGVIDVADFNDPDKLGKGKDRQDRLSNLVGIFQDKLDFSKNMVEGDDILGDAYEYLMRNFATQSGKSKGQFYTPAEVSRVIAKVIGISHAQRKDQTLYDPTCGSGSLLLKAAYESPQGVTIYGQENDVATRALAVMNMWLHENPGADIRRDNTISSPQFKHADGGLKTFDFVVANPPFSTKSWSNGIDPANDEFKRFEGYGAIPPKKNGDYAFLLHIIKSLKSTGKGAIILPHGVLFRGNVEAEIRKNIIRRGYVKGIIGLPPNLFYGTGIPACIIVLDKEDAESRKGIFMIDASKGFFKDGNKNRLRDRDIRKIVDIFNRQTELPKYSRMVPLSEISDGKNDYNLNIPRYIDSQEDEDLQDIEAHLKGDIPDKDINDLAPYWKVCPGIRQVLFSPSKRAGYSVLKVDHPEIKTSILDHSQFKTYSQIVEKAFFNWKTANLPLLNGMKIGTKPKELISRISESILEAFSNRGLIDKYDVYQHLMTYWEDTMQDDAYLIALNGWKAEISTLKNKRGKETGWECDLIPKGIVANKDFARQNGTLETMQKELESINQQMQTLDEENEGEDDLFSEARSEAGKITKGEVTKRATAIKNDPEFGEELKVLTEYQNLMGKEAKLKGQIKAAETDLDKNLLSKYQHLTEAEIKELVVEDKWLTSIHDLINREMEQISHKLAGRVLELADRYESPLPVLAANVQALTKKVDANLEKMGFRW